MAVGSVRTYCRTHGSRGGAPEDAASFWGSKPVRLPRGAIAGFLCEVELSGCRS